ncbi:MAG: transporter related protein, partial [Neobacillus sp.]|nr:transporter related protein [Neobacillus sp.]
MHPAIGDRQLLKGMLMFAKPYRKLLFFSLLLTGFIVIASLAQPFIIKVAIDSYIKMNDYQGMMFLGIIYFLMIMVSSICTYFQNNTLQFTGQYVIYDFRQAIFKHLSLMQMDFFRQNPIGRLVTRITHDVESLNQLYSQVIVNLVKEVLILIGIIALMLYMSVKLTLICFLVIPVIAIVTFYFKRVLRDTQRKL